MDRKLMIKQYVGRVYGKRVQFQVFESGDPQYYVFDPLDRDGSSMCNQFAVAKKDLQKDVRFALRHGCDYMNGGEA